jgi:hypothetical protein
MLTATKHPTAVLMMRGHSKWNFFVLHSETFLLLSTKKCFTMGMKSWNINLYLNILPFQDA